MREIDSEIFNELGNQKLLDSHTHLDPIHLTARGMYDILLYHMVISALYSKWMEVYV